MLTWLATAPADAATADTAQARPPRSVILLAVFPQGEAPRSVVLTCDPAGGTHPRPDDACGLLAEVDGDFTRLTGDPYAGACAPGLPPQPVVATAFGWWQGRLTTYHRSFPHSCELELATWFVYHQAFRSEPQPL